MTCSEELKRELAAYRQGDELERELEAYQRGVADAARMNGASPEA